MLYELLMEKGAQFFVMYASSADANFRYATGFNLPDPALYAAGNDGTELLVVHEMEKRRAERESRVREIASFDDFGFKDKLKDFKSAKKAVYSVISDILLSHRAKKILVPDNFPSALFVHLSETFDVEVVENPFSEMRAVKRSDEIEKIAEVSRAVVRVFDETLRVMKGKKCEEIRRFAEMKLFEMGYFAENTIVASGKLSADPHYIGYGEIEEHAVVDMFPRSREHGYYSDFTRTVIVRNSERGEILEEMLDAVIEAQRRAISVIRDGIDASDVHRTVKECFDEFGFRTGGGEGFVHSTGHGVGLEIHEKPSVGETSVTLKRGMVFTVEPGLYYKDTGGVRVEDVVVVRRDGCDILTEYPRRLTV